MRDVDHSAFLDAAEEAFGKPLCRSSVDLCAEGREIKAVLTQAWHKLRCS